MQEAITTLSTATTGSSVTVVKAISYPAIAWIFVYTGFSQEAVTILGILLVADVMTALIRVAVKDPTALSSRVGIVGILSKCLTFCIPFLIVIVGKGAGVPMGDFANIALTVLVVFEGWSVIGNIGQIRKEDTTLNEYDAVSLLIKKTQQVFKTALETIFMVDGPTTKPQVPERKEESVQLQD